MKITVTIKPDWGNDTTDLFELRCEGQAVPLFVTTIKQPVVVSFEQGSKVFHAPLTIPILFPTTPQEPSEGSQGGQDV